MGTARSYGDRRAPISRSALALGIVPALILLGGGVLAAERLADISQTASTTQRSSEVAEPPTREQTQPVEGVVTVAPSAEVQVLVTEDVDAVPEELRGLWMSGAAADAPSR